MAELFQVRIAGELTCMGMEVVEDVDQFAKPLQADGEAEERLIVQAAPVHVRLAQRRQTLAKHFRSDAGLAQ